MCRGLSRYERSELESRLQREMLKIIDIIGTSKELEKCESPIERSMFLGLCFAKIKSALFCTRSLTGQQIRTQQKLENLPYRADIMLYDYHSDMHMIVECDGREYHHASQELVNHDYKRERAIKDKGFEVVRFTGSEIYKDSYGCAEEAWSMFERMIFRSKDGD